MQTPIQRSKDNKPANQQADGQAHMHASKYTGSRTSYLYSSVEAGKRAGMLASKMDLEHPLSRTLCPWPILFTRKHSDTNCKPEASHEDDQRHSLQACR